MSARRTRKSRVVVYYSLGQDSEGALGLLPDATNQSHGRCIYYPEMEISIMYVVSLVLTVPRRYLLARLITRANR